MWCIAMHCIKQNELIQIGARVPRWMASMLREVLDSNPNLVTRTDAVRLVLVKGFESMGMIEKGEVHE